MTNAERAQMAALLASISTLALATPAAAQEAPAQAVAADEPRIGEIVVTARKREESLLDVPVAVSALSTADINRYQATDLTRIGQMVPQVIIAETGGGGGGASFAIRGIGSSPLDAGIEQTVTVNLDGLQVSRGRIVTQSFFDVEQVEVLKGPQALFFGKNSPGGVISLRTAGATPDWSGFARVGYEFKAEERYFEGAVSGPISDDLGFRVAVRAADMTGYMKNVAGPLVLDSDPNFIRPGAGSRFAGSEELLGRLTLEYDPAGPFDATLKVFGSTLEDDGETSNVEYLCDGIAQTLDVTNGQLVVDPYADCKLNGVRSSGALPEGRAPNYPKSRDGRPYSKYESVLSSLNMNLELDRVTLTSVTGFYSYKNGGFDNFSYSAAGLVWGYNEDKSSAFTQEVRAVTDLGGPFNFVLGGFFESSSRDTLGHGQLAPFGLDPTTGRYSNWELRSDNSGKTYSLFGQAIFDITDTLELAGGLRWTRETKKVTLGNFYVHDLFAGTGFVNPEGDLLSGRFSDEDVSPEVTLTWRPTRDTTLYAAYKTGYKSGGFSNPSILSPGAQIQDLQFGSESAEGGEIGAKGVFMNGRIRVNAALYRYKFNDLQLTSFDADTVTFSIRNAASARTTGFEIDGTFQPTDELQIRAAAGYNDAKYLSFPGAPCYSGQSEAAGCVGGVQDLSGTELVRAPDWSLSAGASYDTPMARNLMLGLTGDVNYTSSYWMQENQNPLSRQDGFARLNASVRVYQEDEAWEVALIGKNLTNKYYGIASFDKTLATDQDIGVSIGRPREIVVQGTVRF